jgi:hypothetical protein
MESDLGSNSFGRGSEMVFGARLLPIDNPSSGLSPTLSITNKG